MKPAVLLGYCAETRLSLAISQSVPIEPPTLAFDFRVPKDSSMRTAMPLLEQMDVLRAYMRTLRADTDRAYREESAGYRKRRICPFAESLRYRRFRNASELHDVARECMDQLRHVRALSIAEFFPGDQIAVEIVLSSCVRPPERFVVRDVEWSKRDRYNYLAWQLTKSGQLFVRGPSLLCPSSYIRIKRCSISLPDETDRQRGGFRNSAREFMDKVRDVGNIDEIASMVRERRERRGY